MVKFKLNTSISENCDDNIKDNGKRTADDSNPERTKRIKTQSLYRQPTVKELNRLQETETLFNSNLFRLQVEEILEEVKVKDKVSTKFQKWFDSFKNQLLTIPENNTEYDLSENTLYQELQVKLPISDVKLKSTCMFKFHKFNECVIVGSYSVGCPINSSLTIDLQITVPAETFTKNDSINYKYHCKRAAYLACIASHLKTIDLVEDLQYSVVDGSLSKPFLIFKPTGKLGNFIKIKLNLSCDEEAYKLHRFSPVRNNLRESWLFSNTLDNETGPPTPYYNSSVLCDLTSKSNELFLNEVFLNSENLKQAVVLLKIWLQQRKLNMSGYVVSMFVAYLVQAKRINNIMSSYQIVRNVWISLKTSEWDTKGITLNKNQDTPPLPDFLNSFPVVFLDRTGYYNICWQMHNGTYQALKRESAMAVDMLDNTNINSFLPLFMVPVTPLMQFDHILRFKDVKKIKQAIYSKLPKEKKLNYGVNKLALVVDELHNLLEKGLGNRVSLVLQLVNTDFSYPVKETNPKSKKDKYDSFSKTEELAFGLVLNPENALSVVEKGPPANLPEAEQFRAFWGDKSELRRFQDGSITETCVWEGNSLADRRMVTKQIIKYLLDLKYNIKDGVFYIGNQLDSVITRKQYVLNDDTTGTGEEYTLKVVQAFDDLRRDLRGLTELPLDISSVYGVSSVFSYCDPLPPTPAPTLTHPWRRGNACLIKEVKKKDLVQIPNYVPVCKAIVELGHSGKWPGDLQAFRCLKAAFHQQIAERLLSQHSLPSQAYPTHLDVLKNGIIFRLEIAHTKEITLLRREVHNGVVKYNETEESLNLQCNTLLLPRLRGALHGLYQKFPAFGPTTALTKRWFSAHLLDDYHFPHTAIELIVANIFVHPEPLTAPAQPLAGFVRVLRMLATADFTKDMIVLDFNNEISREELIEIERKFNERDINIMPCLHIVTAYDGELPSIWTKRAPNKNVLTRSQVLAKSALGFIEKHLWEDHNDNILTSLIPSLKGYDVIIHLYPYLVPHLKERIDKKPLLKKIEDSGESDVIPVVDFHPVKRYLEELRSAYNDFALFFYDEYGGEVIAVLWKPDITEPREFLVSTANGLTPLPGTDNKCKVNIEAIVEDFRIIGEGLVKNVTVNM